MLECRANLLAAGVVLIILTWSTLATARTSVSSKVPWRAALAHSIGPSEVAVKHRWVYRAESRALAGKRWNLVSNSFPTVQVHAAADLAEKPAEASLADFDFEKYSYQRSKMINQALDKALPMAYPPDVVESMR